MKIILKGSVECMHCGFLHKDHSELLEDDGGKIFMCNSCKYILIDFRYGLIIDKVKADSLSFE